MLIYLFLFSFLPPIYNSDIVLSKFKVNYFREKSHLYYVNAFKDDEGNLYFEFWGENDNVRYYIGIN